ncbi:TetR family transcriptional regulator [Haloactinospora alba]|uniref:TetR family transcriptional regulator n=2 Tax=Haloactinospora alba TaxID=405555 RepID=A0A543NA78_9ACTN|nr:TetR family transcriptional regulator [Haloactinospora alba]
MTSSSSATAAAPQNPRGTGTNAPLAEQALARAPLRRLPAQQRSMARVQRMLDACAELLDEHGYGELSTTRIAERAGVAVGSVYQFFPDKKAITQALGLRFLDVFSTRVTERLLENVFSHWAEAVDVIIDEYLEMHRTVPGFRSLHFGDVVDMRLLDSRADNNRVLAQRLCEVLTATTGVRASEELDRAVTVAVESGDAALKLAFRHDPDGDPHLIEETKLLLRSYLGHHVA